MPRKKKQKSVNKAFVLTAIPVLLAGLAILVLSSQSFFNRADCGCGVLEKEPLGNYDPAAKIAYFNNQPIEMRSELAGLADTSMPIQPVLGESLDHRWIEIDLSDQRLYAHEGDRVVYDFLISSGKWAPTPTGSFRIWIKLKYTKMSGGSKEKGTYYYLPNVPFVMYFYKGYGIHGAYWHQNFGQPMSHGCINMATPDAEKLFYWASPYLPQGKNVVRPTAEDPGTQVIIHD